MRRVIMSRQLCSYILASFVLVSCACMRLELPRQFQLAGRMDTQYPSDRVSQLVIFHVDGERQRVRDDYFTVTRTGLQRHHSSFRDYQTLKHVMASTRMKYQDATAPASCMEVPILDQWPLSLCSTVVEERVDFITITVGLRRTTYEDVRVLATALYLGPQCANATLWTAKLAPQDIQQSENSVADDVITSDEGDMYRLLMITLPNHNTNFTVIHALAGDDVLRDVDAAIINGIQERDPTFMETSSGSHESNSASLRHLFNPDYVADIECEKLG